MPASSLKFGTSGLRGLAADLQGQAARRYTAAFLRPVGSLGQLVGGRVYLGRDFRASSQATAADGAAAIAAAGLVPVDCGAHSLLAWAKAAAARQLA